MDCEALFEDNACPEKTDTADDPRRDRETVAFSPVVL